MNCQSRLDQLFTSVEQALRQIDTIRRQPDRRAFSDQEIQALTGGLATMSIQSQHLAREQAILTTLDFAQRPARYDGIPDAHQKTFTWIFHTPAASELAPPRADFSHWLRSGEGVFWIAGRPGSGKSALMKFTADHALTREMLSEWAAPQSAYIGTHYFWSAGTDMQRSQEGLLRSLLFEIMRQVPSLVPVLCPQRWNGNIPPDPSQWRLRELQHALAAVKGLQHLPLRFCFFIDGLDEFDGDHSEICETVTDLCESPNIKICVSSRPWNVFEDALGGDDAHRLNVHDLTREDILNYAQARLHGHPRWAGLVQTPPKPTASSRRLAIAPAACFSGSFSLPENSGPA